MSTFSVRRAAPSDEPDLGRLAGILVRMHAAWNPRRFLGLAPAGAPRGSGIDERGYGRWLVKEARDARALVLVAEREGAVVGYAYARFEAQDFNQLLGPHAALHDILVDESARGGGIGPALLDELRRECAVRGVPRIVLHAAVQNEAGQKLFAKSGFAPTMVEMTCELAPRGDL